VKNFIPIATAAVSANAIELLKILQHFMDGYFVSGDYKWHKLYFNIYKVV
jgi:hypothetical protein